MAHKQEQAVTGKKIEASRRKFLKTAGKIAVYTPPAMLVLSQPSFAEIQTTGGQSFPTDLKLQGESCGPLTGPSTKNIVRLFCRLPS